MKETLAGRWAVALVALGLFATTATAGSIQKLDFAGTGGTIAYTQSPGSSFDAMGTINSVQRLPGGSGIVSITDGSMDIVTGSCSNAGNGCFTPNGKDQLVLTFANSASNGIVVFGGISKYGIPNGTELFAGQLMKTGVVLNGPLTPVGPDTGSLAGQINATFINSTLLTMLGLSPTNSSNPLKSIEQLNFTFTIPPGVFGVQGQTIGGLGVLSDSSINLTDLSITAVPPSAVPEPASLILFGSSVLLAAGVLRRKLGLA
jgi:hypothetical protein